MKNLALSVIFSLAVIFTASAAVNSDLNLPGGGKKGKKGCSTEQKEDCKTSEKKSCCPSKTDSNNSSEKKSCGSKKGE